MAYKVTISKEITEYWLKGELLDYINNDIERNNGETITDIIPISDNDYKSGKAGKDEKGGVTLVFEDSEGEEHAISIPNTKANFNLLLLCFNSNENLLDFVRLSGETLYDDGTSIDFENDSFRCIDD